MSVTIHAWLYGGRTRCGFKVASRWTSGQPVTCKRCLAAIARLEAKAARSNTESSAGRIPRTPGR